MANKGSDKRSSGKAGTRAATANATKSGGPSKKKPSGSARIKRRVNPKKRSANAKKHSDKPKNGAKKLPAERTIEPVDAWRLRPSEESLRDGLAEAVKLREALAKVIASTSLAGARYRWIERYGETGQPLAGAVRDILSAVLLGHARGDRQGLTPLLNASREYLRKAWISPGEAPGPDAVADRVSFMQLSDAVARHHIPLLADSPTKHEEQRRAVVELDRLIEGAVRATSGRALKLSDADVERLVVKTYEILLRPLMSAKFRDAGCTVPERDQCLPVISEVIKQRDEKDKLEEGGKALLRAVARKFGAKGDKAKNLLGALKQKDFLDGKSPTTREE